MAPADLEAEPGLASAQVHRRACAHAIPPQSHPSTIPLDGQLGPISEPVSNPCRNYFVLWHSLAVLGMGLAVSVIFCDRPANRKNFIFTSTAGVSRAGART
jgi:hypothetical protein